MASYKVIGGREVAGKQAGETVSEDDLAGCNIPALIEAGHLAPITTTKATKAETSEEQ